MKPLLNRKFVLAVLTVACLMTVLLTVAPIRSGSPSAGEYDPWLDWNDDSKIDMKDIGRVAKAFGTNGQNISKASMEYDSGWIDLTGVTGQNITVTHGLNITDWNDENIDVSIIGKTGAEGELQRYLGLTGKIQGWNKTYGGTGHDELRVLVQTNDGGYALTGWTNSSGAGSYDCWLAKTDTFGNIIWNQTYGGTSDDYAYALVHTSDGGYALAGWTTSFGAGGYDCWLVRTDASGNMQWNKTYGRTGEDVACALVQTTDGGYALAGWTITFGDGQPFAWLVKTDSAGDMQWNRTCGGGHGEYAWDLVQTTDGGYALAGSTWPIGASFYDFWLAKTDASGNAQWSKHYGGSFHDWGRAMVQTSDGGYALAGYTLCFGSGAYDIWLVKTDATGNMQWNKTYGGTNYDVALALVKTSDGGYALAGYTRSFGAGGMDCWLIKTDANFNMQWNRTYGGTGDDEAWDLVQTRDGGYALAGMTESFGAGSYDFWLVKTDVESGLAWIDSSANTVTLYRGATDPYWNYVRVRLWKPR
jgi:predicted secreted protein